MNRDTIIADSVGQFKIFKNLKKVLNIKFESEVSQDRGGLSREYFQQILKALVSEGLMLF